MPRAWRFVLVSAVALMGLAATAGAETRQRLRIEVGRAEVVSYAEDVRTVAIAEPKIANAAVGSARTVVVNAKAPGITTLVIYGEGARYNVYDVEVVQPNGHQQVKLAVRVAEADSNASRELGLDVVGSGANSTGSLRGGLFTTKVSTPSDPLGLGPATDGFASYAGANGFSLQTIWRALESKGHLRVLAQPTLVARSGEKASFHAGGEFPIPIASSVGAAGGGAVTVTIEWKAFGVQVSFTPTVEEDSSITLVVDSEVSQLDFSNSLTLSGFNVPSVVMRRTSTTVRLKGGEHLVIGGLKQTDRFKNVRRIPILGAIPIVGMLFSHVETEATERELLVVVSPEVLAGASTVLPALPTDGGR